MPGDDQGGTDLAAWTGCSIESAPSKSRRHDCRVNRYTDPPMTLGGAAAARVRLIVWCRDCRHQIEPAAMAEHYGADLSVPDWHKRLACSACGSRQIDFVVTGAKR